MDRKVKHPFFSDGSYIAEPASSQSHEFSNELRFCFGWFGRCSGRKCLICCPSGRSLKFR